MMECRDWSRDSQHPTHLYGRHYGGRPAGEESSGTKARGD